LDEKGNAVGFEVEVLKEVNRRLPQYKFEFQTGEFKSLLISLGSNKIDIAAHQFAKNPEREKNYLFAKESYTVAATKITVLKTRNDIKTLDDLNGKNVQVSPGSNDAYLLEKYNNEHGNKLRLVYGTLDNATLVKSLQDGKIDATTAITRTVDNINKALGDNIKTVGEPLYNSYTYHIFRKSDTKLRDDVDKALIEMKKDGTLSKLSVDILGADYTK
jgi:ABC-type amino acid transport substrate-binding protein